MWPPALCAPSSRPRRGAFLRQGANGSGRPRSTQSLVALLALRAPHRGSGSDLAGSAPGTRTPSVGGRRSLAPQQRRPWGQPVQEPVLQRPLSGWADLRKSALLSSISLSISHTGTRAHLPAMTRGKYRNVTKYEDAEKETRAWCPRFPAVFASTALPPRQGTDPGVSGDSLHPGLPLNPRQPAWPGN